MKQSIYSGLSIIIETDYAEDSGFLIYAAFYINLFYLSFL